MSDRCNVKVYCRAQDREVFEEEKYGGFEFDDEMPETILCGELDQTNLDVETLPRGIPYYGSHTSGCDYGAALFACDGRTFAMTGADDSGHATIRLVSDNGTLLFGELGDLAKYLSTLDLAKCLMVDLPLSWDRDESRRILIDLAGIEVDSDRILTLRQAARKMIGWIHPSLPALYSRWQLKEKGEFNAFMLHLRGGDGIYSGQVTHIEAPDKFRLRLDQHMEGLSEWDNCLHFGPEGEAIPDAEDFLREWEPEGVYCPECGIADSCRIVIPFGTVQPGASDPAIRLGESAGVLLVERPELELPDLSDLKFVCSVCNHEFKPRTGHNLQWRTRA